ncbi:MAG: ATP-binding cassette domain-containing protein [Sphingobacteriia bacterium]|nr:ATP-binding cassette domain-containing protein [Sphingobacteriia bacterium]
MQVKYNFFFFWAKNSIFHTKNNFHLNEDPFSLYLEESIKKALLNIKENGFLNTINSFFKRDYKKVLFLFILYSLFEFCGALSLFISLKNINLIYYGTLYNKVVILLNLTLIPLLTIILYVHYKFHFTLLQCRTTALTRGLIYDISLKISKLPASISIINIIAKDCENIGGKWSKGIMFISPIFISFFTLLLYYLVDWISLVALIIIIIFIFLNLNTEKKFEKIQNEVQDILDSKINCLTWLKNFFKEIKICSFEHFTYRYFKSIRENEENVIKKSSKLLLLLDFLQNSISIIIPCIVVSLYLLQVKEAQISKIFTSITILTLIRYHLYFFARSFIEFNISKVATQRITLFISEWLTNEIIKHQNQNYDLDKGSISVKHFNLNLYTTNSNYKLPDDLTGIINPGECVLVWGETGIGKTTFINTLVNNSSNCVLINGKVALCGQEPLIINDSIKNNIIFFEQFDEKRYREVIEKANLVDDIDFLPFRDLTIIQENGINLSEGQKQRINIARICYKESDIYIFDDPFCSQDPNSVSIIYNKLMKEFLKNKTRIIITSQIDNIEGISKIIILSSNEFKVYEDPLEACKKYPITSIKSNLALNSISTANISDTNVKIDEVVNIKDFQSSSNLISSLIQYTYKIFSNKILIGLILLPSILQLFSNNWLSYYYDNKFIYGNTPALLIYFVLNISAVTIYILIRKKIYFNSIKLSSYFFNSIINKFLQCDLYSKTIIKSGDLINRLSYDTNKLDCDLPSQYSFTLNIFSSLVCSVGYVILHQPKMSIIYILAFLFINKSAKKYLYKITYLSDHNAKSISTLLGNINESSINISQIRNTPAANYFNKKFINELINILNISYTKNGTYSYYWLMLELAGIITISLLILFIIFFKTPNSQNLSSFLISTSFMITQHLSLSILEIIRLKYDIGSFERIDNFNSNIDGKINYNNYENRVITYPNFKLNLTFNNVSLKYPNSEILLEEINISINSGEKIAVIGRSGVGKTTLFMTLMGFIKEYKGSIKLNNLELKKYNKLQLESLITWIPQKPIIYPTNIRNNIDPYNQHEEEIILKALEQVNLLKKLKSINNNPLEIQISNEKQVLSKGEQQLLSFCRAILNPKPLILLDEPDSSLDMINSKLLDNIIKEHFSNSTVITITHKHSKLINYDRVYLIKEKKICLLNHLK